MSSDYQITGSVTQVYPSQSFPSGFVKREFVVTTEDEYPQPLKFEVLKEKCVLLDGITVGERVNVRFRIRGSVTKDGARYFVNLQAWTVDRLNAGNAAPSASDDEPLPREVPTGADDDMPF